MMSHDVILLQMSTICTAAAALSEEEWCPLWKGTDGRVDSAQCSLKGVWDSGQVEQLRRNIAFGTAPSACAEVVKKEEFGIFSTTILSAKTFCS